VAERHDVDTVPEVVVDLAAIEDDDEYLTDLGDCTPADPDGVAGQHLAAFRDEVDGEDLR
jgi:hypothetical protein